MTGRVVIWGVGKLYNQYVNALRYLELVNKIEIVGVTDMRLPQYATIDGWKLIEKEEVKQGNFDWIIVMSEKYFMEIANEAEGMGIDAGRIFSYKILNVPDPDFEQYYLIKKNRVSIISNNCWGGLLYATLGLECCSPFKNLFVKDDDYIKLLSNLREYMSEELVFHSFEMDRLSCQKYPVMLLGDIRIHCNHDNEPELAKEKWDRRKRKLNWDNIFVEMYTENQDMVEKFIQLDEFANKLAFVPFASAYECVHQIKWYPGHTEFYETVNKDVSGSGYYFYILDILSGKLSMRVK